MKTVIKIEGNPSREGCAWVGMVFRMYQRWAEGQGQLTDVQVRIIDVLIGDEGGENQKIIFALEGARGARLASEAGIHRLVRISPFDLEERRHTSFALVTVNEERSASHVRSYILNPYTLVKDVRTSIETVDAQSVLDGTLDQFL